MTERWRFSPVCLYLQSFYFRLASSVDDLGNVAMFDIDGKEIWERHVGSHISTPTAGLIKKTIFVSDTSR